MAGFVEEDGRISETVLCSFAAAAAHAESRRRDDAIDLLCDAFCNLKVQHGQTTGFVEGRRNFLDRMLVSRRARLLAFGESMWY